VRKQEHYQSLLAQQAVPADAGATTNFKGEVEKISLPDG
jgi:hypothetical protein